MYNIVTTVKASKKIPIKIGLTYFTIGFKFSTEGAGLTESSTLNQFQTQPREWWNKMKDPLLLILCNEIGIYIYRISLDLLNIQVVDDADFEIDPLPSWISSRFYRHPPSWNFWKCSSPLLWIPYRIPTTFNNFPLPWNPPLISSTGWLRIFLVIETTSVLGRFHFYRNKYYINTKCSFVLQTPLICIII